jgi:hypothetical protein
MTSTCPLSLPTEFEATQVYIPTLAALAEKTVRSPLDSTRYPFWFSPLGGVHCTTGEGWPSEGQVRVKVCLRVAVIGTVGLGMLMDGASVEDGERNKQC